jgi:hypothetical protein
MASLPLLEGTETAVVLHRRTGTLRALLAGVQIGRADGTTGVDESRPGWGLRQQRRVHAVFGRAERHSPIEIHLYVVPHIQVFSFVLLKTHAHSCRMRGHVPGVAYFTRRSAGSAAAVVDRTRWRTHNAACVRRSIPLGTLIRIFMLFCI